MVFLHTLITIVSYLSFLLLIVPMSKTGLLLTVVLLVPGAALLAWRKLWTRRGRLSGAACLTAVGLSASLGLRFYSQWLRSVRVQALAALLHIPHRFLVILGAVGLSICAIYFISGVLQQLRGLLKIKRNAFVAGLLLCVITAAVTVVISQQMILVKPLSMGIVNFIWCAVIVFIVILTLCCLCGEMAASSILGSGLFMILSTINVYVFQFRERLVEPVDIFSLGTAMNVAEGYSLFPIPDSIVSGWVLWLVLSVVCVLWPSAKAKRGVSAKQRGALALCCLIGVLAVAGYTADKKTYHWYKEGATFSGFVLDFVAKIKETHVVRPDGYSPAEIEALSDLYAGDDAVSEEKPPHIIVIMDEAFSDLGVIGEISTDREVTPFISALKEEAISGYALASVYGGNTANSEYEFLTGNSMAWLSPNAVPFQQYIRSAAYSMVSHLKTQYQYKCIAMHPYLASGWNRPDTYAHLGFDESYFVDDFPKEYYVRNLVSDRELFEMIVEKYETQREEPLFLYGVTMQNHGGYVYEGEAYEQSVSLVGYDRAYSDVEQYLSLLHETDKAVEYLVSYFEKADDDVVIVFFGDHQPKIDRAFYEELRGSATDTLDDLQTEYMVPFFIWTSYETEPRFVECTSLNYLASYVYEAAGLPLPPYNRFLSEMEEYIPAINANGFYSPEAQRYLDFDMASEEENAWLKQYEQLQYNSIFDKEERNRKLFPILEQSSTIP